MHIDSGTVQKIKDAAKIVDVVDDFVTLRKSGVNYKGLCPFHDDHNASLMVSPKKNIYKCFVCGKGGDPVEFLMEHEKYTYAEALGYLAKKYDIFIDEENEKRWANVKKVQKVQKAPVTKKRKLDLLVFPKDFVLATMRPRLNLFVDWFNHLPWCTAADCNQRERVDEVLWLYCVGKWGDGRVVFWQIDSQGRPRTAKLMVYGLNGKRDKTKDPTFIHTVPEVKKQIDWDKVEKETTLFGAHLLTRYPNAVVNIVESEKTALICATSYGNYDKNIWLASGGMKFLNAQKLRDMALSGRRVWLWPDKDGIDDWKGIAAEANHEHIRVTTKFLDDWWIEEDGPKADIADIIVRHMTKPATIRKREEEPEQPSTHKYQIVDDGEPFDDYDPDPRVQAWRDAARNAGPEVWKVTRRPTLNRQEVEDIINSNEAVRNEFDDYD